MGGCFWCNQSSDRINAVFESIYNDTKLFNLYRTSYWDKIVFDYLDIFDVFQRIGIKMKLKKF